MGKLTINMVIFNSYVTNYQRVVPPMMEKKPSADGWFCFQSWLIQDAVGDPGFPKCQEKERGEQALGRLPGVKRQDIQEKNFVGQPAEILRHYCSYESWKSTDGFRHHSEKTVHFELRPWLFQINSNADGFVWKCRVPRKTQWFCWSLSLLNGYNWGYTPFSDIPKLRDKLLALL